MQVGSGGSLCVKYQGWYRASLHDIDDYIYPFIINPYSNTFPMYIDNNISQTLEFLKALEFIIVS